MDIQCHRAVSDQAGCGARFGSWCLTFPNQIGDTRMPGRKKSKVRPKFVCERILVQQPEGESARRAEARELFVRFLARYGMKMQSESKLKKTG